MLQITVSSCEPNMVAPHSNRPRDPWLGMSSDLIGRFLDVLYVEYRLSSGSLAACSAELHELDDWMRQSAQRTLATADAAGLQRYLAMRAAKGISPLSLADLLGSMRRFFWFLRNMHCRDDDPTECLSARVSRRPDSTARGADAYVTAPQSSIHG